MSRKLAELSEAELRAVTGGDPTPVEDSYLPLDNCPNAQGCTSDPATCRFNHEFNRNSGYICDKL